VKSATAVQAPPGERCAHIQGTLTPQDARKVAETDLVFCVTAPTPAAGAFMAIINATEVPVALAPKERATMGAVLASFSVDTAALQRMAHAYAAPAIDAIHAVGRAAAAQAAAAQERNDIQNSSVYQHWDSIDRRSKDFSDYLLGYTVVQDNAVNGHATLWNEDADALVRTNPQRFEYVTAPNFWKGIDY
jgi:exonuclease VII large subunit